MKSLALILLWACIALHATAQTSGLTYNYYEGSWDYLPNFSTLIAVKKGSSPNISLSARNRDLQYAFVWKGQLRVPFSGTYTFETVSDDGSQLAVGNSATPVVNNDGLHASQTAIGTVYLNAGTYPITISFFQQAGMGTMEMYWSSNTGLSREAIPNSAFTTAPTLPSTLPPTMGLTGTRNYYISSSTGDDSRTAAQAQSSSTPWKSLARMNSFFKNMLPGDATLLKRGDTFNESLVVGKSGVPGSPIIISAYGTGNKPVINGFLSLTNWSAVGNGVYQSDCASCSSGLNTVLVNGNIKAKGRYPNATAPNKGYLTFESHSGNNQITDNELTGSTNWQGGEVVIRKEEWIIDKNPILRHSGSTLTYTPQSGYPTQDNWGYFIQGHSATLDVAGEWYFNPSNKSLQVYFGSSSAGYSVRASVIDTLVNLNRKNYVTIDNISINGADKIGMQIDNSTGVIIQNCDVNNSGIDGINGEYTNDLRMLSNTVNNSLNNGVNLVYYAYGDIVRGNVIKNSGVFAGMGRSGDGTYCGVQMYLGKNNLIEYNEVDSSGYIGIGFYCDSIVIRNNLVNYFDLTKQDGGGIYACAHNNGDPINKSGKVIIGNIVLNGIGISEGTSRPYYIPSDGIYIDDRNENIQIIDNTVANCAQSGMYIHNSHDLTIKGNTFFNNAFQMLMGHDNTSPLDPIRNNIVSNNIAYANNTQFIGVYRSPNYDVSLFGTFENNYYCKPLDTLNIFNTVMNGEFKFYSFNSWKSAYSASGLRETQTKIMTFAAPRFEYNASSSSKVVQLDGVYMDLKNQVYANTITLAPYTSVLLVKSALTNNAPVANAGNDLTITMPLNSVTLDGTKTYDVDRNLASHKWTKIAGPGNVTLVTAYATKTIVNGLAQGTFTFTLTATDKFAAVSIDTVKVFVNAATVLTSVASVSQGNMHIEIAETTLISAAPESTIDISIYPNPTADILNLSFRGTTSARLSLNILNAEGKMIRSNTPTQGKVKESIDVRSLTNGLYYLQVKSSDGNTFIKSFIKH